MRYINQLTEGENVSGIYLCKQKIVAQTKAGKDYWNLVMADKTGTINSKVWEINSMGIRDFEVNDYVDIHGRVVTFNGGLQLNIDRAMPASEGQYDPSDYVPVSPNNIDAMYSELKAIIGSVQTPYFRLLLENIFINDTAFAEKFKNHSAAKSVHHGFVGGLLHHTLSVCRMCGFYCTQYPVLDHDLLITAAMCHDIGKIKELSSFPANDYTDDGQLLGHIVMGVEIIGAKIAEIKGFPVKKATELKHCILAHHGEFEFGSPKKPALVEAVALNFADNTDAKIEAMTELFENSPVQDGVNGGWLGYSKIFESNVRKTL